jgi:hypothetical protein
MDPQQRTLLEEAFGMSPSFGKHDGTCVAVRQPLWQRVQHPVGIFHEEAVMACRWPLPSCRSRQRFQLAWQRLLPPATALWELGKP